MRSLKRYIELIFLIVSFILSLPNANAQNEQDVIRELKEKFNNYTKSFPREEVFVHTDREEYIAGEESFFTSYIIDRQTFKLSTYSKIVYVELLNSGNIPVLQKKFIIEGGSGPGSLKLPDTLTTGIYRLIAYTSWMKNFLPENYFTKEVKIYNLLKDEKAEIRQFEGVRKADRLPQYLNTGVSFNVNRNVKDSIILEIEINEVLIRNILHLVIQNHGNIIFAATYPVENNNYIPLPATLLKPGINQITLFSADGKPVSERLIYSSFRDEGIGIQCNDINRIREEITVNFTAQGINTDSGHFSISVAPGEVAGVGIGEYMITGTEFGISYTDILGGLASISIQFADSILAGITSNWINWQHIVDGDFPECRFPIESEYHYLMGNLDTEKDVKDVSHFVFLCSPGRDAFFRYAVCDEKGRFLFAVAPGNEINDYVIIPDDEESDISIESPFISHDQNTAPVSEITGIIPAYIPKWSINYQVNKLFEIPDTSLSHPERSRRATMNMETESNQGEIRFYGKPDTELIMDDYISLPVMEEVFFEILPNVSIRKRDSKREIIITDRVNNMPYQALPCLMIDGVIISSADLIINLDPELVEKIDVIKEKYIVGKYVFHGIVNVITRNADFTAIELPAYMKRITYTVSNIPSAFTLPDTQNIKSRIPDYRNTLYWNPLLTLGSKGNSEVSFTSSDNASDYTITIQGVTEEGVMVSNRKVLKVVR